MTELAKARSSLLAVVNWISQLNAKRENLISEVGVNLFCQFCVIMDVKCSFSSLVGGSCSYDPRDRSRSTEVIPFLNCKRDIAGHKSSLSITDVETEIELIWGRVSTSFSSELDLSELTICPRHRSSLGIGWRRGSNLCRVPPPISKHGGQAQKNAKAERGLGKVLVIWYGRNWEFLFQLVQVCIHHFSSFSTKQTSSKMAVQSDTSIKALCKHFSFFFVLTFSIIK